MSLRRSVHDRFLGGVLGGVASALRVSPTLVRLLFLILLLSRVLTLPALVLYGLAWMFLPEARDAPGAVALQRSSRGVSGTLRRSRTQRQLAGVCGGLATYYRLDPLWLRLGVVAFALLTLGWGSVLYVLAALTIPQESL